MVQSIQSHSQSEDQSEDNGQRIGRNPDPNPVINNSDYYCKKIQNWLSVTDVNLLMPSLIYDDVQLSFVKCLTFQSKLWQNY